MFLYVPFKLAFGKTHISDRKEELFINHDPKKEKFKATLLIIPSICDVFATILDCIGLIFVNF